MKSYHNQRQYSRSKVAVAATLTPAIGEAFGVEVVDLSMSGIFLNSDRSLEAGTECQLTILFGHFKHELPIIAEAVVVRSMPGGIALRFKEVKLETLPSMQGLIIDHADDPELAKVECSSGGGYIFQGE